MTRIIDEIKNSAGFPAAMEITRAWGGKRIYIPKRVSETHPLSMRIGYHEAMAVSKLYGGRTIHIPDERNIMLKLRNKAILSDIDAGASFSKTAIRYGISERMIRKIWVKNEQVRTDKTSSDA